MAVKEDLERSRADALFFQAHREELLDQYAERWVAVYEQHVVATADRLPQLLKRIDRAGLPRGRVFIEFLSTKEDLLILGAR